ncbi:MAG: hypothetical protein GY859_04160 [Desulfobacterales bacterium]|nr:hypothetical protein [Desulfobacterales bacterium]
MIIFHLMHKHRESRNYIFRLMAGMLAKGFPLPQVLESLADISPGDRTWLNKMAARARDGNTLSDIIRQNHAPATPMVKSCIATGEKYNILPRTLALACELDDKKQPRNQRVNYEHAMILWIYIVIMLIVFSVSTIFVLPVFEEMYTNFGAELPAGTMILASAGEWIRKSAIPIAFALLAAILFNCLGLDRVARLLGTTKVYRISNLFFWFLEKIPLVGKGVRFLRWWRPIYGAGTLFQMGVPLEEAIQTMADGLFRPSLFTAGERIARRLEEGRDPADAITGETAFPSDLKWMIAGAGAELPRALIRMGNAYRDMGNLALRRIVFVADQLIILSILFIGALMVILQYLPIFKMARIV